MLLIRFLLLSQPLNFLLVPRCRLVGYHPATLTVAKVPPSLISTKRVWDKHQDSHQEEGSPKQTHLSRGDTSWEVTPFLWMHEVSHFGLPVCLNRMLLSCLHRTCPLMRIPLNGRRWSLILRSVTAYISLHLCSLLLSLAEDTSWLPVISPRKGTLGKVNVKPWSISALVFRRI